MNKFFGIGRLTAKPKIKYTTPNNAVASFTLATNRIKRQDGTQEADFINCRVWNKQAENLCKYQDKGSLISIEGQLRVDSYLDNQGAKKYTTYVLVNNIEYLQSKNKNEQIESVEEDTRNPFADFGEQIPIEENFLD